MVKKVITPGNLGTEFDVGIIEASKIRLKLGTGLQKNVTTGALEATGALAPSTISFGTWAAPRAVHGVDFETRFEPVGGSTSTQSLGGVITTTGTASARALAATSLYTSRRRFGVNSAATAGALCGAYGTTVWLGAGNTTNGGFLHIGRFGIADAAVLASARMFYGMRNAVALPTNVEPQTYLNSVGIGKNAADTNLRLFHANASTMTTLDLGANFPANTSLTDPYLVAFYFPRDPAAAGFGMGWYIKNERTGQEASGTAAASAIPAPTAFMAFTAWRSNNATAQAVSLDLGPHKFEQWA